MLLAKSYGASLEAITLDSQTALHYAARYGSIKVNFYRLNCQSKLSLSVTNIELGNDFTANLK